MNIYSTNVFVVRMTVNLVSNFVIIFFARPPAKQAMQTDDGATVIN